MRFEAENLGRAVRVPGDVQPRPNSDLQHSTPRQTDDPLAIGRKFTVPHRELYQMWNDMVSVEAHDHFVGEFTAELPLTYAHDEPSVRSLAIPLKIRLLTLELTPECTLKEMTRAGFQIGKVSEQTGLSIDAIRFYEKQRLLDRPPRTEGGFRLFSPEDIERI